MSSSTSSSNPNSIYRKTLLVILMGMFGVVVLWRIFTEVMDASADTILGRVMMAKDALPRVVQEEKPLVMFYGSSMVQAGFSPRMFDRWLAEQGTEVKSFNYGFGGLNPYFQEILSRRIKEEFDDSDRRLKLAMIEFNPFQTTQTRWNGAVSAVDSFMTMLASDAELLEIAKTDLRRGLRLFNIRYLRNNISAEITTTFFGGSLQTPPERADIPEDEVAAARRNEINELLDGKLAEDYPDYDGEPWFWPWQGGGTIPPDRSEETVELIKELIRTGLTERRLTNDRMNRVRTADIIELQFEELLIESFIQLVKNFQTFSDQVEVVLLPRNTEWIDYSPEGWKRLEETVARIERETGIKMVNMQDLPEIRPDMFSDTTHLGRYTGDIPFTRLLVDTFGDQLKP